MKRTDRFLLFLFWWWLYRRLVAYLRQGKIPWQW